jgi:hypothetical protein
MTFQPNELELGTKNIELSTPSYIITGQSFKITIRVTISRLPAAWYSDISDLEQLEKQAVTEWRDIYASDWVAIKPWTDGVVTSSDYISWCWARGASAQVSRDEDGLLSIRITNTASITTANVSFTRGKRYMAAYFRSSFSGTYGCVASGGPLLVLPSLPISDDSSIGSQPADNGKHNPQDVLADDDFETRPERSLKLLCREFLQDHLTSIPVDTLSSLTSYLRDELLHSMDVTHTLTDAALAKLVLAHLSAADQPTLHIGYSPLLTSRALELITQGLDKCGRKSKPSHQFTQVRLALFCCDDAWLKFISANCSSNLQELSLLHGYHITSDGLKSLGCAIEDTLHNLKSLHLRDCAAVNREDWKHFLHRILGKRESKLQLAELDLSGAVTLESRAFEGLKASRYGACRIIGLG